MKKIAVLVTTLLIACLLFGCGEKSQTEKFGDAIKRATEDYLDCLMTREEYISRLEYIDSQVDLYENALPDDKLDEIAKCLELANKALKFRMDSDNLIQLKDDLANY